MSVDIDEADVAVLNQNLVKSKELFGSISQSLTKISKNSSNASTRIKPVLRDVNELTTEKQQIEIGIDKLEEVSEYAERTSGYETILNNSIDIIGVKKYIDTLNRLKILLEEMKVNIKKFYGILINFENLIDKLELNLVGHFKKLLNNNKFNEVLIITKYFGNRNTTINRTLVDSRAMKLQDKMREVASKSNFSLMKIPQNQNIKTLPPYEKGSNGINPYCHEFMSLIGKEHEILMKLSNENLMERILTPSMNDFAELLEKNFNSNLSDKLLVVNDLLVLEIIENLDKFSAQVNTFSSIGAYPKFDEVWKKLCQKYFQMFKELFKYIEGRILTIEKMNELNSTEVVVELITKLRKLSDYKAGANRLVQDTNLGDWLNIKPTLKFITVYTSVIPNNNNNDDDDDDNILSSLFSDLIDCIMINIEIQLKSDINLKKSTQGFYLVKNIILIETIINRSHNLFEILGQTGIERLNKLKNRFLKLFLDDWNYASYIIIRDMTQLTTLSAANNKSNELSNKEKDTIKELFKNFNESFDDALTNFQKFNITDVNLKTYLISEIKKLIINAYFKLYDKYGTSNFTKNKSKYVKFNKFEFENILNERLSK